MIFLARQKTGVADTACVAILCMATTMMLGFSSPGKFQEAQDVQEAGEAAAPPVFTGAQAVVKLPAPPALPLTSAPIPAIRPSSLARNDPFSHVLGKVSSRMWLRESPDSHGSFHGVGFPDIRTHQRKKPSPFDAPGPWAPLVAWRTVLGDQGSQGDQDVQGAREPIARVRCMGLTPQAVARRADRYRDLIYTYADEYDVNRHLIKAVITEESCFDNTALSPVGAQGLMQLMPDTASWLDVKDVHDPAQNLRAGVSYLASLQKQFNSVELILAAYNAGPGNVRRYDGIPPFAETEAYVKKVQANYRRYKAAYNLLNPAEELLDEASFSVLVP